MWIAASGWEAREKKENTVTKAHALISSDIDHRFIPTHSCVLWQDISIDPPKKNVF